MRFPKLAIFVFALSLLVPTVAYGQADAGTASGFAVVLEPAGVQWIKTAEPAPPALVNVEAAIAEAVAEVAQQRGFGLVEGIDYQFVAAGSAAAPPAVDSIMMTSRALDKLLDEIETLRNRNVDMQEALAAAEHLILTRDELLGAMDEKTRGERWYIRALQVGGGLAVGYLAGDQGWLGGDTQTVVIR